MTHDCANTGETTGVTERFVEARRLVEEYGATVKNACQRVGIPRETYYYRLRKTLEQVPPNRFEEPA